MMTIIIIIVNGNVRVRRASSFKQRLPSRADRSGFHVNVSATGETKTAVNSLQLNWTSAGRMHRTKGVGS